MNRRLFVFGIGVGIIIGAGLLQLMLIGERQADALTNDGVAKTYTQAELDQAVADERERVQAELTKHEDAAGKEDNGEQKKSTDGTDESPAAEPVDSAAPASESAESVSSADKADKLADKPGAEAEKAADAKPSRVIVRIPPNASVAETAALLASRGIISDKQAFIDLMRKRTIRAGYFAFQGKLSLQQVRVITTSKPLDPAAARKEMEASQG